MKAKWLLFQTLINEGYVFIAVTAFFGSMGSFLYVFRPLAALFLGQELPEHRDHTKEAPFFMLVPMMILSLLSVYTGVLPNHILPFINDVTAELGSNLQIIVDGFMIQGWNDVPAGVTPSYLHPLLIAGIFAFGVGVAFFIFIVLKKSKKVDLMDTYTAGNFVYTEELLHYSVDFYAPLERLYEKYIHIMKNFYKGIATKVREFGAFMKYFFFTVKPEITVLWIIALIAFLLWGDVL